MSYLVLARKWRPQVFEHIRGQEHIVRALKNAIRTGRIAHAYIFTGIRGVGKTSAARVLAKALNCVSGPTAEPCNHCDACREITEGRHPDVLEIDGASNNSVEDVRKLRDQVRYPPVRGRYRVYIIDEVHMLSSGAFNALLKTLEEPPKNVVFIFATTDAHKVPVTILSRCQEFDFKRLSARDLANLLGDICKEEGILVDPAGLITIAREAEGSVRDAQSLLDQVISYAGQEVTRNDVQDVLGVTDRGLLIDLARALLGADVERLVRLVSDGVNAGIDAKRLAVDLLELLRDLTVLKTVDGAEELVELSQEEIASVADLVRDSEWEELHARFDMLQKGLETLRNAPRPVMALEMTLIKMARLPALIPLEMVASRLERLPSAPVERKRTPPPEPKPGPPVCSPSVAAEAGTGKTEEKTVSPSPEPAAKAGPLGPETILEALGEGIPSVKEVLAKHCRVVLWDPGPARLVIEVDADYLFAPMNKKGEMVEIVSRLAGRKATVEIVVPKGVESTVDRDRKQSDLVRKNRRETLDHPVVRKALDIFGGDLEEVKNVD